MKVLYKVRMHELMFTSSEYHPFDFLRRLFVVHQLPSVNATKHKTYTNFFMKSFSIKGTYNDVSFIQLNVVSDMFVSVRTDLHVC